MCWRVPSNGKLQEQWQGHGHDEVAAAVIWHHAAPELRRPECLPCRDQADAPALAGATAHVQTSRRQEKTPAAHHIQVSECLMSEVWQPMSICTCCSPLPELRSTYSTPKPSNSAGAGVGAARGPPGGPGGHPEAPDGRHAANERHPRHLCGRQLQVPGQPTCQPAAMGDTTSSTHISVFHTSLSKGAAHCTLHLRIWVDSVGCL
jgi:hypothetical protein